MKVPPWNKFNEVGLGGWSVCVGMGVCVGWGRGGGGGVS